MSKEKEFKEIMMLVKKYGDEREAKPNAKGSSYFFIKPDATFENIAERLIKALERAT